MMKKILLIFILAAFAEGKSKISMTYDSESSEESEEESEEVSESKEEDDDSEAVDEQPDKTDEEESEEEEEVSDTASEEEEDENDHISQNASMMKIGWNDDLKTKPILEAPFRQLFPETNAGFSGKMQVTLTDYATESIKPFLESFVKIINDFPASNVASFSPLVNNRPRVIDGYSNAAKTEILKQLNDATRPLRFIRNEITEKLFKVKDEVENDKREINHQLLLTNGTIMKAQGLTHGAICRLDGAVQLFEGAILRWRGRKNY